MTRRARVQIEGQIPIAFDGNVHPAVERARALRRSVGLCESLTKPEVLEHVKAVLRVERSGHRRQGAA